LKTNNDLAVAIKRGFNQVDKKFDDFALMVKHGFDGVDKRFDSLEEELDTQVVAA